MLDEVPEDKPSKIYLERCGHYRENPPPPDWDGVFNRLDK
jgi:adenylate cyclase